MDDIIDTIFYTVSALSLTYCSILVDILKGKASHVHRQTDPYLFQSSGSHVTDAHFKSMPGGV